MIGIVLVDHALGEEAEHLGQVSHEEARCARVVGRIGAGVTGEADVVVEEQDVVVAGEHVSSAPEHLLGVGPGDGVGTPAELGVGGERIVEHDLGGQVGRGSSTWRWRRSRHGWERW